LLKIELEAGVDEPFEATPNNNVNDDVSPTKLFHDS
jgi:hypothetical protein